MSASRDLPNLGRLLGLDGDLAVFERGDVLRVHGAPHEARQLSRWAPVYDPRAARRLAARGDLVHFHDGPDREPDDQRAPLGYHRVLLDRWVTSPRTWFCMVRRRKEPAEPPPCELLGPREAARHLGISLEALKAALARCPGQLDGAPIDIGTGKRRHYRWDAAKLDTWWVACTRWQAEHPRRRPTRGRRRGRTITSAVPTERRKTRPSEGASVFARAQALSGSSS